MTSQTVAEHVNLLIYRDVILFLEKIERIPPSG